MEERTATPRASGYGNELAIGFAIVAVVTYFVGPRLWVCLIPAALAVYFSLRTRRIELRTGGRPRLIGLAACIVGIIVLAVRSMAAIAYFPA